MGYWKRFDNPRVDRRPFIRGNGMTKVIVLDLKEATYMEAYAEKVKGKIVHVFERLDLDDVTGDQAVDIHNNLLEEDDKDRLSRDTGAKKSRDELWDMLNANMAEIGVEPPNPNSAGGKGGKGAKVAKSSKAAAAKEKTPKAKGRGNAANLIPRKRKHAPELRVQFMKSVASPYEGKKESNRSKIFDQFKTAKILDDFYKGCDKAGLVCGNWDVDNALEKGCIKLS